MTSHSLLQQLALNTVSITCKVKVKVKVNKMKLIKVNLSKL